MNDILLFDFIKQQKPEAILVDAAGVINTNHGYVDGISATLNKLQSLTNVFLTTNNSYMYPQFIHQRLKKNIGFTISIDNIISSGRGLSQCPEINDIIKNKIAFHLGTSFSLGYLKESNLSKVTENIDEAEVIILMAFTEDHSNLDLDKIINIALQKPDIPIICCNGDFYIPAPNGRHKVVGYYTNIIETAINRSILWFGKPYSNFSKYVKKVLLQHNIKNFSSCYFFDDNIRNVRALEKDLGIHGIFVHETGIFQDETLDELSHKYEATRYTIPALKESSPVTIFS